MMADCWRLLLWSPAIPFLSSTCISRRTLQYDASFFSTSGPLTPLASTSLQGTGILFLVQLRTQPIVDMTRRHPLGDISNRASLLISMPREKARHPRISLFLIGDMAPRQGLTIFSLLGTGRPLLLLLRFPLCLQVTTTWWLC